MKRLVIVQPYIPDYRVPLFTSLFSRMRDEGVDLVVAHGAPTGAIQQRSDSSTGEWAISLPTRRASLAGRDFAVRDLSTTGTADLMILEQALGNLDAYLPLVRQGHGGHPAVALWGHGRTYGRKAGRLNAGARRWVTNRAHWFYSYTQGGADYVHANGFPLSRITVVKNTIDQASLTSAMQTVTEDDLIRLQTEHRLGGGPYALYIGGVDPPKRIDFLLEAAALVAARTPGFQLLVAGSGSDAAVVQDLARQVDHIRYVGRATGYFKAVLAHAAQVLMVPGAIGLVAVDSFAMGVPIVTTPWPYHGPEFEYLRHGANAWIAGSSVDAYADAVSTLLNSQDLRDRLAQGCRDSAPLYTLDAMVDNFTRGVIAALEAPPR